MIEEFREIAMLTEKIKKLLGYTVDVSNDLEEVTCGLLKKYDKEIK